MERILATDPTAPAKAAQILAFGGVILYPTDTLYGLGADALSDEAVAKVYAIKGRDEKKPIHCIVADMEMAMRFGEVNELAGKLASKFLPGPLTLILKKKPEIGTGIARGQTTIGIRIPDNEFCRMLAGGCNKPFTTTSANMAGEKPGRSVSGILDQLGESASTIDLVIDAGELSERLASTVVDVSSGEIVILREGAIPSSDIFF
jgi:L-threonylcarbamoyladenylate synthase